MKARRLAFAVPFVVTVACERPVEVRAPVRDVEQPVTLPPDAGLPVPIELVDELRPLHPRPAREPLEKHPAAVEPVVKRIREIQRGVVSTRVRIPRDRRMDDTWRAVFVTSDHTERGECTIVEWDARTLECTTELSPEQLVVHGETLEVRLSPSAELVAEVEAARWRWEREPQCCSNPPMPERRPPPEPTGNPPAPLRARVIRTEVLDDRTIVTAAKGSDDGVQKSWTANIVDEQGMPIKGGACAIVRINNRVVICTVRLTPDQITATPYVRLKP